MAKVYAPPVEVGDPPDFDTYFDENKKFSYEKMQEAETAYTERLALWCRENGSGQLAGTTVRYGIADGYAVYMVLSERPLHLIHVPLGDAYQMQEPFERGLRLSDIRKDVAREKTLAELFGKSNRT